MEYLILESDKRYVAPSPLNWFGKLDRKTWNDAGTIKLPNYSVFYTEPNMQMVFTDIITFPCFMVSKEVRDVILLYDPFIRFQRIIFFSKEKKMSMAYYFPNLEKIDCLMEGSVLSRDRSVVKHAKINTEKLDGKAMIRIDNLNCNCILVNMDLANSILRRETIGIGLRETECI